MRQKLNLILITAAILGAFYFQFDWMAKTYATALDNADIQGTEALGEALKIHNAEQQKSDSAMAIAALRKYIDNNPLTFVYYWKEGNISKTETTLDKSTRVAVFKHDSNRLVNSIRNELIDPGVCYIQIKDQFLISPFKTDSVNIVKHFKARLAAHGMSYFNDIAYLDFAKSDSALVLYKDNIVHFNQNTLHRYPDRQWVGLYLPHQTGFAIRKVVVNAIISLALIVFIVFYIRNLTKTIKRQKQLAESVDDFIDSLTHEFKTPIATVSAAVEAMQSFNALENKERTARYLAMSKSELSRLNDMVTKLLAISVNDGDKFDLDWQLLDMTAMVNEIIAIEKLKTDKPVVYEVDIDDAINHIHADPLHLKNVLINLIDNAIKYSRKPQVNITITGTKRRNTAWFIIKDDGNGIPPVELDYIFDKFYRVSNADRHLIKGSGLGLSYVQSVIEAHGWAISVNSTVNVYTEFIISIPLT